MSTTAAMDNYWLPFSANRAFRRTPRVLVGAKGIHYYDEAGNALLDSTSGLYCSPAGHGREEIVQAVSSQLARLDYSPSFQFAHPDAFVLSSELAALLPPSLDRLFFVNSGSEAVDTAMKGALAYHRARGEAGRVRFVGHERAYHGVNFGGTSVGGIGRNRSDIGVGLPGVSHMRHTWSQDQVFTPGQPLLGADLAEDLQRIVDLQGAETIAAVIVEPIAGSTGILVPPVGYLERLREIATTHGILLIFDEVITGFGRTGNAFAAQTFGVVPDIITMAKALTNGTVPMGAVAFSHEIYDAVVEHAPREGIEFAHGYTYSSHPVATAAALASLRIYREEGLFERAASLSEEFQKIVFELKGEGPITDIRGFGLLAALDLEPDDGYGQRGYTMLNVLFAAGLVARFAGDTLILAPPFVASAAEMARMVEIVRQVVRSV